jgi:hypothetical protein
MYLMEVLIQGTRTVYNVNPAPGEVSNKNSQHVLPALCILTADDLVKGDKIDFASTSSGHNLGDENPKAEVEHVLLASLLHRKTADLAFEPGG